MDYQAYEQISKPRRHIVLGEKHLAYASIILTLGLILMLSVVGCADYPAL